MIGGLVLAMKPELGIGEGTWFGNMLVEVVGGMRGNDFVDRGEKCYRPVVRWLGGVASLR